MTIEIKDTIYLITYIITLISIMLALKSMLAELKRDLGLIKKIIFGDRGVLNLIDAATCKKNRDEVFTAIRRAETVSEMLVQEIKNLNENVMKIKFYLEIDGRKSFAKGSMDSTDKS